MKTIFLIPDTHHPMQDARAVRVVINAIRDVRPDEVCILGDWIDCRAPARWSRGLADEYLAGLDVEAVAAIATQRDIRRVYDGPLTAILGNHEDRIQNYIEKHAPALTGVVPTVAELLKFDELGIELKDQPYSIAPGVRAIHGKRLSSTQQSAGQSAYKERMRLGHSVVQGHTHRLGVGWDSQERSRFWLEAGCLLDLRKADYLDYRGVANWQQGFAMLHVDGSKVWPEVVPIHNGRAVLHGRALSA